MGDKNKTGVAAQGAVKPRVLEVRGKRVVLDRELAALVGIDTKYLKRIVKRNHSLFNGDDLVFELTQEESLRCQTETEFDVQGDKFVTLNNGRGSNIKYLPYAFTGEGVKMLEKVLKRSIGVEFQEEEMLPAEIIENDVTEVHNGFKEMICEARGQEVMLDFDLAKTYKYTTAAFNQQIKNNIEKFPAGYIFRLTKEEYDLILISKNFTSSWGGNRRLPYAFTEKGVYRLMTILKSELALHQTEFIIGAFSSMKRFYYESRFMCSKCELKQLLVTQTTQNIKDISEVRSQLEEKVDKSNIREMMEAFIKEPKTQYHLMDGEFVQATKSYTDIYNSARKSIFIIDNYIDVHTLKLLTGVGSDIRITVFSDNIGNHLTMADVNAFKIDFPTLDITFKCTDGTFHDRYIMGDYKCKTEFMYHCGASSKDSGGKVESIMKMSDSDAFYGKIESILNNGPMPIY